MAWQFKPLTYDGVNINNATYVSKFVVSDNPLDMITSDPQEIMIPGDYSFPEAPRAQMESGRLYLMVQLPSNTQAAVDAARLLFDRMKGAVSMTIQDGGVPTTWTLSVRCERLVTIAPKILVATLYAARPIMESALRTDSLRTISATPTTWSPTPTPIGTVRSYPSLDLTATVAKANTADYTKRYFVNVAWQSELRGTDSVGGPYPYDVANDAFDTAAEIAAGRMQADGDDITVLVDDVITPRALDGINTTTTKVWVGIYFSPKKSATLAVATTAVSPANGGEIEVSDELGLLGWPEFGYFKIDNEVLFYGERTTTKLKKIKRAQRNTTAAIHALASTILWVEHKIEIIHGWTAAPTPVAALFSISTILSTNLAHAYQATFTSPLVRRIGQMLRRYTADNVMSPLLSSADGGSLGHFIIDRPAGGTRGPYNNMEYYVPCGVKAAASALAFDCNSGSIGSAGDPPGADIVLNGRVYGIDVDTGVERLLATYKKADRGAGKTLTPDAVLQRVRFNAVYAAITGGWRSDTPVDETLIATITEQFAQRFTLDQATRLEAFALYIRENASGDTRTMDVLLRYPSTAGGLPEPAVSLTPTALVVPNSQMAVAYGWVTMPFAQALTVPARSDYDLTFNMSSGGAGTLYAARMDTMYSKGHKWSEAASTWSEHPQYDYGFLIIGDGSVVQPEAPSNMGGYVAWDTTIATFDDATPRTPSYFRSPQENIYVHRGVISSDTTGQSITVFYIAALNELITIDCYRREVILDDTQGIYAPGAVTLSDPEQWMHMPPGANTLRYVETTPGTVTITTKWKDGWA